MHDLENEHTGFTRRPDISRLILPAVRVGIDLLLPVTRVRVSPEPSAARLLDPLRVTHGHAVTSEVKRSDQSPPALLLTGSPGESRLCVALCRFVTGIQVHSGR